MENFLQVDKSTSNIPASPTDSSFAADEVTSICPLITPSPPTNDLINSLPEPTEPNYVIGHELATILQHHAEEDGEKRTGGSSSSSTSAIAEAACSQLLTHRNSIYHHISKDEQAAAEETNGKVQPLQLTFRNPPDNYFFMSWNWPLIRKISFWTFISGMAGMVALVVAMIISLPKTCNPETEWYQGSVFYEIFPASFYDSNNDMIGDLKGISQQAAYIKSLGVSAVRLNSIFKTQHYPEDYKNVTTLMEIAPQIGNVTDLRNLATSLHVRNISLILDLPIYPVVKQLSFNKTPDVTNNSISEPSVEFLKSNNDIVKDALFYWTSNGVDGFYLKGLEHFIDDPNFGQSIYHWKRMMGPERPIIVEQSILDLCPPSSLNIVLNNIDLVDIKLNIEKGVTEISKQMESIQNGTLFSRPGLPWIHWTIGDEHSCRLANILPYGNATLGATLLQLMLPGTPSIFYGNEIGLQQILDPTGERQDLAHLHQFAPMPWPNKKKEVLSWLHGEKTSENFDQIDLISKMIALRSESPSIYVNSVYKEGDNKANADVKYSKSDLLVIQRWYPRRKSYVIVSNLGGKQISADLSTMLYSGLVVIGPKPESEPGSVSFKNISLWPGEAVIILLD